MLILVGCEESQEVCKAFRALGHEAYSCDVKPCSGGHPEWHLQMDVFEAIKLKNWEVGIFFPDCTFLTCSAEWAYKDQPPLKSGKLVGEPRREARKKAIDFFMRLVNCGIEKIAMENPIGRMSTEYRKPDQIIQPYQFGEDASKATCLWLKNLPLLVSTEYFPPRIVNGKPRWGNRAGETKQIPGKINLLLRKIGLRCAAKLIRELQNLSRISGVLNKKHLSHIKNNYRSFKATT